MTDNEITPIFNTEPELYKVFNETQIATLNAARHNIETAFNKITFFRTPTLLRLSVLNDLEHPTLESKYFQLVNEMYVHSSELANLIFDIELKQIDIEELETRIIKREGFERRRDEIEIRRKRFELVQMQKTADARIKEIENQSAAMNEIKTELKKSGVDIEAQTMNDHQLRSFAIAWTNDVCSINDSTDVASRKNIISRWITCMNVLKNAGELERFIQSLPDQQREKLTQLKLIDYRKEV